MNEEAQRLVELMKDGSDRFKKSCGLSNEIQQNLACQTKL